MRLSLASSLLPPWHIETNRVAVRNATDTNVTAKNAIHATAGKCCNQSTMTREPLQNARLLGACHMLPLEFHVSRNLTALQAYFPNQGAGLRWPAFGFLEPAKYGMRSYRTCLTLGPRYDIYNPPVRLYFLTTCKLTQTHPISSMELRRHM